MFQAFLTSLEHDFPSDRCGRGFLVNQPLGMLGKPVFKRYKRVFECVESRDLERTLVSWLLIELLISVKTAGFACLPRGDDIAVTGSSLVCSL